MTFVNVCFLIVSLSPTASTYVFLSLLPSLPHVSPSSVLPPSFSILPVFFPLYPPSHPSYLLLYYSLPSLYFTFLLFSLFVAFLLRSSVVLFDLLVNILGHNLAEPAYEAEVAQLEYKLVAGEHGLVIKVKGFNHKLPVSKHTYTHR